MTRTIQFSNSRPSKIEDDFITFPPNVFNSFFNNYSLDESHHLLWELLKLSFCGKLSQLSSAERQNLMSFYENLHDLLTAASATYTCWPAGQLSTPVRND